MGKNRGKTIDLPIHRGQTQWPFCCTAPEAGSICWRAGRPTLEGQHGLHVGAEGIVGFDPEFTQGLRPGISGGKEVIRKARGDK